MSSTRTAKDPSVFRQERYSSSSAFEIGLMGNHVAKRACLIKDPKDRAVIYFLQQESHKEGGLDRVAKELLEMSQGRIGTPTMHSLGKSPDEFYTAEEITLIREELPSDVVKQLPLKGECDPYEFEEYERETLLATCEDGHPCPPPRYDHFPTQYSVSTLLEHCRLDEDELAKHLATICLNPNLDPKEGPRRAMKFRSYRRDRDLSFNLWNFNNLLAGLHSYRESKIKGARQQLAQTEITTQIHEDMEYALETKSLVIIEGLERMGKSVSAENFCDQHPGRAIYLRLESGTDEKTFFRSIARAIGVSSSSQLKTIDMRVKIQDMLQHGHAMLVIDEAHFLWPQTKTAKVAPRRVDWLRTALVDFGVPVVLISTPQFDSQCKRYEKDGWNSRQIRGRLALHRKLDPELSAKDLEAIARHKLPYIESGAVRLLREVSETLEDYVAAIERIVKRATYFAIKQGKDVPGIREILDAVDEIIPAAQLDSPEPEVDEEAKTAERGFHNLCKEPAEALKTPSIRSKNRISKATIEETITA